MHSSEPYVLVVVIVALPLLILAWLGGTTARRREKRTASARASDTKEGLLASFRPELRPVADALYDQFQQYTFTGTFPFRKSDVIAEVLNIDGIDLDEALTKVANQFGCHKPTADDDTTFKGRRTFEDYAELIHHLRPTGSGRS